MQRTGHELDVAHHLYGRRRQGSMSILISAIGELKRVLGLCWGHTDAGGMLMQSRRHDDWDSCMVVLAGGVLV